MKLINFRRVMPFVAVSAAVLSQRANGAVLYSTIQGSTAAGSAQPAYSSSLNLTGNTTYFGGPIGFGDDYTTAYTGLSGAAIQASGNAGTGSQYLVSTDNYVQISALSFYGDIEPGPNGSTITLRDGTVLYSLGGNVEINFFDKSGARDLAFGDVSGTYPSSTTANQPLTASSIQGPGLHTITFASPLYIPASGYMIFEPYLAGENAGNGNTPEGTVAPSFTGYFGGAPTVGTSAAGTFATMSVDGNGNNVLTTSATYTGLPNPTPANPDGDGDAYTYTPTSNPAGTTPVSSGFLQLELDGVGLGSQVPEPASLGFLGVAALGILARRRTRRV